VNVAGEIMPSLILLRHGQSEWNLENRFTGWADVDLSEQGRQEAVLAGQLLAQQGLEIEAAFTSVLKRAIRTLWTVLDQMDRMWLPCRCHWRLNERHYGALEGLNKAETAAKFGEVQVRIWRRSYDSPPPPLDPRNRRHPRHDPRYAALDQDQLPAAESLKDTLTRLLPAWREQIRPVLQQGGGVLIAAHGNSIRALIKHLEQIPDSDIPNLEIPTGNPLVYEMDKGLVIKDRRYLDPQRSALLPNPSPAD
jgi:2,3-bisphosphoglycerate-dependent phosphoglycerate mutase